MRKTIFYFLFLPFLFFISCTSPEKLSEDEVKKLIREANKLPSPYSLDLGDVRINTGLGREIERLVKEGYMIPGDYMGGNKITEKGKDLILECHYNPVYKAYEHFYPIIYKVDIKQILEIVIDSKNNLAEVKYELGLFPTSYLEELKKIDTENIIANAIQRHQAEVNTTKKDNVKFKKWDRGWRIIEGEE
jgi:hypothetical protein